MIKLKQQAPEKFSTFHTYFRAKDKARKKKVKSSFVSNEVLVCFPRYLS